jgi:hypothetical protein
MTCCAASYPQRSAELQRLGGKCKQERPALSLPGLKEESNHVQK